MRSSFDAAADDDGLVRSLPRIAHLARQDEARDVQFRSYLKTELPLSNRELDDVVHEIGESVSAAIDCTACGNCCRTLQIVVHSQDIARLAKRLEMTIAAFTERYVGVADDGSTYFSQGPPCPFLSPDGPCTVYEDRPRACQKYPLTFPHVRSHARNLLESRASCPIVFNVWNQLRQRFERPAPPRRERC